MRATTLYDAISYGGAQRKRIVKLDTPLGSDWLLPMYVKGHARLGRDYEFVIDAISTRGKEIKLKALIGKAVTLWILQADGTYLPHHG
ncbi:MAG: type VI secretion system tip protein VgrG, partial [Trinickia sp.]